MDLPVPVRLVFPNVVTEANHKLVVEAFLLFVGLLVINAGGEASYANFIADYCSYLGHDLASVIHEDVVQRA